VSEGVRNDVVLVTGSSGLIGSAVIRRLADRYRLVGFDRESNA
jgi:nucleoside-diphosphate-sugar epimerase